MPAPVAIFAAGCFWGVEAAFRRLQGVTRTTVGYTGGEADDPTYKQVCRGRTGHAEAVEVEYDPAVISYSELLETFWASHNPTTRNRQGLDIGSQYRSAIFFADAVQHADAVRSRDAQQQHRRRAIVTAIVPAQRFWPAEDYHQQYLERRGRASCAVTVDAASLAFITRLMRPANPARGATAPTAPPGRGTPGMCLRCSFRLPIRRISGLVGMISWRATDAPQ